MADKFFEQRKSSRLYQNPSTIQNSDFSIPNTNIPVTVRNDPTYGTYRKYADGTTQGRYAITGIVRSAATALTTNVVVNIGSMLIPIGVWRIGFALGYIPAATTTISRVLGGITRTSATRPSLDKAAYPTSGEVELDLSLGGAVPGLNTDETIAGSAGIVVVPVATTFYLFSRGTFGVSTLDGYGSMWIESVA